MKTVTAKELRLRTSAVLEETRRGNEVMITLEENKQRSLNLSIKRHTPSTL